MPSHTRCISSGTVWTRLTMTIIHSCNIKDFYICSLISGVGCGYALVSQESLVVCLVLWVSCLAVFAVLSSLCVFKSYSSTLLKHNGKQELEVLGIFLYLINSQVSTLKILNDIKITHKVPGFPILDFQWILPPFRKTDTHDRDRQSETEAQRETERNIIW